MSEHPPAADAEPFALENVPRPSADANRDLLALVRLADLMSITAGRPEIKIGLIDGPVRLGHPDLPAENLRFLGRPAECGGAADPACGHGTFVAGILAGRRGSVAPAICPGCTLLVRPIFGNGSPGASPGELAAAMLDSMAAGARVLNLSLGLLHIAARDAGLLDQVLAEAVRRGVLLVAAAGNEGAVGGSALTCHPWVLPVAACDRAGRPLAGSNLGRSIGRRGLLAPGAGVHGLAAGGTPVVSGGTSAAAAFVTGALALLWSLFPAASAATLRAAIAPPAGAGPVPPLLDAEAAYRRLAS